MMKEQLELDFSIEVNFWWTDKKVKYTGPKILDADDQLRNSTTFWLSKD